MKLKQKVLTYKILSGLLGLAVVLIAGNAVRAYMGEAPEVVVEGDYIQATTSENLGAFPGGDIYNDVNFHTSVKLREATTALAPTNVYATTTLSIVDSGSTFFLSASGTTITLPAVSDGGIFRFVIDGAVDTGNYIIDSYEGDNIEGALIVAGAVVDCDAEDQINFVADGENLGDFVELRSNGTKWFIGSSGALTEAKLTCTDPS